MGKDDDFKVNEDHLNLLISSGVSQTAARNALIRARNDLGKALDFVSSSSSAPATQAVPPTKNAAPSQGLSSDLLANVLTNIGVTPKKEKRSHDAMVDLTGTDAAGGQMDDIQMALQASLMQPQGSNGGGTSKGGDDSDEALQLAIASSMREVQGDPIAMSTVSTNPHFRKREEGNLVGLKNIGNTCYFNSLLQTYYMIPEVRSAVLNFPPLEVKDGDANKDVITFMKELQRLFAFMIGSNQKWVDPSRLLNKLTKDGKPISIGEQEDVAEFNEIFLKTLQAGLTIANSTDSKDSNANFIHKMFYGSGANSFMYKEQDGSPSETIKETEFTSLILPIPKEEPSDLYSCIEASLCDELEEYTTDKGFKTSAKAVHWMKSLPKVLMLRENRVQYDREKKTNVKRETAITVDKEIFVDRYLIENKDETTKRRVVVSEWRKQLHDLEVELRSFTHFKGRDHGLDEALQSTLDYLKDLKLKEVDPIYDAMIAKLTEKHNAESAKMNELKKRVAEYKEKIGSAYADMNKNKFVLIGAWLHQGFAGGGHYWAHLRNIQNNKWMKFNDVRVTEVDEETVLKEATGGSANTSAYFLIYINEEMFTNPKSIAQDWNAMIAAFLKKDIEEDNQNFIKELGEYDLKHADKHETFFRKYQDRIQEVEKLKGFSFGNDPRVTNFFAFLASVGNHQLMMAEVMKQTYEEVFNTTLQKDIGTGTFKKVEDNIAKEITVLATKIAFDDGEVKGFKELQESFVRITQFYEGAMNDMVQGRPLDAVRRFYGAIKLDRTLPYESLKREREIAIHLMICYRQIFDHAVNVFTGSSGESERFFKEVIVSASHLFPIDHKIILVLKEMFVPISETARAILSPVQANRMGRLQEMLSNPLIKEDVPFSIPILAKLDKKDLESFVKKMENTGKTYKEKFEKQVSSEENFLYGMEITPTGG